MREVTARLIIAFRDGDPDKASALHDQMADLSLVRRDSEGVSTVEYMLKVDVADPSATAAALAALLMGHRN